MSTFPDTTAPATGIEIEPYWLPQRDASEAIRRIDETLDLISDAMSDSAGISRSAGISHQPARELSVVIPVRNQRPLLPKILESLEQLVLDAEILLVDDGSVDGTRECLCDLPAHPDRRVIYRRAEHGMGSAIRLGVRHSGGSVVAIQHVDGDYDPVDLTRIVRLILEGESKAVYGSHDLVGDQETLAYRAMSWLATTFRNVVTGSRLSEIDTVHKASDGDLLRSIALKEPGFGFESEITAKIASRVSQIREIPISSSSRESQRKSSLGRIRLSHWEATGGIEQAELSREGCVDTAAFRWVADRRRALPESVDAQWRRRKIEARFRCLQCISTQETYQATPPSSRNREGCRGR